MIHLDKI